MRRLVSIMFADMAGYTALMQQNEREAIRKRERLKEVLDNFIPAFHGEIVEYAGDGALSIFISAIEKI